MTEQKTVSAAMLTMLERLSWETQFGVCTERDEYSGEITGCTLEAHCDTCRFCGVPHAYPHAADCQIKALGALLGIEIENPNSKPGDESYEDACKEQEEANRAYAARQPVTRTIKPAQVGLGDGDDMDDPFSDH